MSEIELRPHVAPSIGPAPRLESERGWGADTAGDQGKDAAAAKQAAADEKKRQAMLEKYKDPAFRERQSKGAAETWKDPEYRKKISKARKEQHARGKGDHAVGHDDA
jgi:hypothetical protein